MAYDIDTPPGGWVTSEAQRLERVVWSSLIVVFSVALCTIVPLVTRVNWSFDIPLVVGLLILRPKLERQMKDAANWLRGARSEVAVGTELETLRRKGFVVMHDLAQEFEGNVDHLVSGPTGVFMVETKHRIFLPTHLTKAKRQAARLSSQLGGTWVTAVICLDRDLEPRKYGVAWAMGRSSVVDWIAAQKNRPVAFDDLARFADRL